VIIDSRNNILHQLEAFVFKFASHKKPKK